MLFSQLISLTLSICITYTRNCSLLLLKFDVVSFIFINRFIYCVNYMKSLVLCRICNMYVLITAKFKSKKKTYYKWNRCVMALNIYLFQFDTIYDNFFKIHSNEFFLHKLIFVDMPLL